MNNEILKELVNQWRKDANSLDVERQRNTGKPVAEGYEKEQELVNGIQDAKVRQQLECAEQLEQLIDMFGG